MSSEHNKRVTVVVLGDFGRSPRMQYHALALADSRIEVDVVAYAGSAPLPSLREHPRVTLHLLPPRRPKRAGLPSALVAALMVLRVCTQSLQLLWMLGLRVPKPDFILIQNPPAIPTLLVALIAARARSATVGHIDSAQLRLLDVLAMPLKQGPPIFAPGPMVQNRRWAAVAMDTCAFQKRCAPNSPSIGEFLEQSCSTTGRPHSSCPRRLTLSRICSAASAPVWTSPWIALSARP